MSVIPTTGHPACSSPALSDPFYEQNLSSPTAEQLESALAAEQRIFNLPHLADNKTSEATHTPDPPVTSLLTTDGFSNALEEVVQNSTATDRTSHSEDFAVYSQVGGGRRRGPSASPHITPTKFRMRINPTERGKESNPELATRATAHRTQLQNSEGIDHTLTPDDPVDMPADDVTFDGPYNSAYPEVTHPVYDRPSEYQMYNGFDRMYNTGLIFFSV
jgi:hypothetical protein